MALIFSFLMFASQIFAQAAVPVKIMPLGDSLTAGGYNIDKVWHVDGGYREHLWRQLTDAGFVFDFVGSMSDGSSFFPDPEHEGYSGWRIEQVDAVTETALTTYKPDVVLLLLGTNDVMQKYKLGDAPDRLLALVKKILSLQPGVYLFVSSLPPTNNGGYNKKIQKFNKDIQKKISQLKLTESKLQWVDMYKDSGLTDSKDDLTDGVHPTRDGYKKMAVVWFKAIKDAGVFPTNPTSLPRSQK